MCWTGYSILNMGQTLKNNSQITFKFCVQGIVLKILENNNGLFVFKWKNWEQDALSEKFPLNNKKK